MKLWIENVKQAATTTQVAKLLGAKPGKNKSFGPCPACKNERRSKTDQRKPLTIYSTGKWVCYACSAKGDGVDLVSIHLHGARLGAVSKDKVKAVRGWFASHGFCENGQATPKIPTGRPQREKKQEDQNVYVKRGRPPAHEIVSLWKSSLYPNKAVESSRPNDPLVKWLLNREFSPQTLKNTGLIKVTPLGVDYEYPEWWPRQWSYSIRLITPAYEPNGKVASLHGRSVVKSGPKTRWPLGYEAGGLWMANRSGVHMMRGQKPRLSGVLICEGITDLMRAACQNIDQALGLAVLAGTSGSFRHVHQASIPKDLPVYLATDDDGTGDKYARIVVEKLKHNRIYRLNLAGTADARS
tara:strand:- start:2453 stop:3514 length:1062 start_codon:yes stop_codon:yes gene_type:complete